MEGAVLVALVGLTGLGLVFYFGWRQLRRHYPELAEALQHLRPWVLFWAFWGAVFGAMGAAILMKMAQIPPPEATLWIIFGVGVGTVWGAIWGLVFGLTER